MPAMPATVTPFMIDRAAHNLTVWLIQRAHRLAKDVGFSYEPSETAPDTFQGVREEFAACGRERRAFRVWSGASDRTIYTNPEANYAFRFIHDVYHAVFGLDFTTEGEKATAARHIKEVEQAFGVGSLEARLMEADTIGQVEHFATAGGFIDDQRAFAHARILSLA